MELKPEFAPLSDEKEILKQLKVAAKSNARCVWWLRYGPLPRNSKVTHLHPGKKILTLSVPIGITPERILSEVRSAGGAHLLLMMPNFGIISFNVSGVQLDKEGLQVEIPNEVFELQRRKGVRYQIPLGYELNVNFMSPTPPHDRVVRRLLDISVEGLSFYVEPGEKALFSPKQVMKEFYFAVRQRAMVVNLEIKHIAPLENHPLAPGFRIGGNFKKISEEDSDFLSNYIAEQAVLNFYPDFEEISRKIKNAT